MASQFGGGHCDHKVVTPELMSLAWLERQQHADSKSAHLYYHTFLRAMRKRSGDGLLRHKEMVEWSESPTGGRIVHEELERSS